jgi:lipoprotein NlpI
MKRFISSFLIVLSLACYAAAEEPLNTAPLKTANEYISRGMRLFKENKIDESIRDFDQAAKLAPPAAPHLWQRGISHYYAGEFQKGREQFESHKAVNPHDVENATWHFICVAKPDGLEAARKALIEIDTSKDLRVPMAEVYELYAGRGSEEAVLAAAAKADTPRARMYAHLYLGLYYEVADKHEQARQHMQQSAAAKLQNNYMHEVAKIHLKQRNWDK